MISLTKLPQLLADRKISMTSLKFNGVVVGASHDKLAKAAKGLIPGDGITLKTINALCAHLDCQPGDILEYVPDE